jgi:hypothetical protein
MNFRILKKRRSAASRERARQCWRVRRLNPEAVIAGLDPAIHLLLKKLITKSDGYAGQARV